MSEEVTASTEEQTIITPENTIEFGDFLKVYLVSGTITEAEPVKKSKKLYCMQVNLGKYGKRQILAGIAEYYSCEELVGRKGCFVINLEPRQLMGLESQGMTLCAKDDAGNFSIVNPGDKIENGTRLS